MGKGNVTLKALRNKSLRNSIQARIILIIILTSTVVFAAFALYDYFVTRAEMNKDFDSLAEYIVNQQAKSLALPLWYIDSTSIKDVMSSAMIEKQVHAVIIRDESGIVYGEMRDNNLNTISKEVLGDYYTKKKEISINDEKLGSVEVYLTPEVMRGKLDDKTGKMLMAIIVLNISLVTILFFTIKKSVILPVKHVAENVRTIASGDLDRSIHSKRKDELGRLASDVESMRLAIKKNINLVQEKNKALQIEIMDRKQAEDKIKYSQLQFEAVLNNLDSGIYISDMETHEILFINQYMKDEFGKDITGQICWKSIHENQKGPCDFCTNDKLIDASGNPKEPYIWEIHNQILNRWYELHDQAIPWTDGRLVRMEIAVDITERKISEMAIQQREQYLKALNRAAQLLLIPTDTIPFQEVVDEIGLVSNASRVYIFINHLSPDNELLASQKAEWCAKGIIPEIDNPALQNISYDNQVSYLKETLQRGDVFKGRVADLPDKEREILEPQCILAILVIPIMINNEPIGFIGFDNCVSDSMWTPTEQTFLSMAADNIAQTIQRIDNQNVIRNALNEKVVLLREIHHRVKNNMQVIISLIKLQSQNITDKRYLDMFTESRDRIKSMALVHEKLYHTKNLADIDFRGYVKSLVISLFRSYGIRAGRIALKIEIADISLGLESAIPCGLIINELISNSLKYAFPEERAGEIRVALNPNNGDELVLEVSDNGIGISEDLDVRNTDSMGLHLVTILSEDQLHGKIEVNRTGGTKFQILFKKHTYKARI